MKRSNERPPFAAVASDAKRFLGLRTDIRELINVSRQPSESKCISKTLHHPLLNQLRNALISKLNGGSQ